MPRPSAAGDGPLAGLRFGVKDIIDVAGMPTGLGLTTGRRAPRERDAFCVALLRAAGALPVGKTHTTALASVDPARDPQPGRPGADAGRFERGQRGRGRGGRRAVRAGHPDAGLGRAPGRLLRRGRLQADLSAAFRSPA